MDIYRDNSKWKMILAVFAGIIIIASLIYTNFLAKKIESVERNKMELYANTLKKLDEAPEGDEVDFYFNILNSETTIPLIFVDNEGEIRDYKNLDPEKAEHENGSLNTKYLSMVLEKMSSGYEPITIDQPDGSTHFLYYRASQLLNLLKWFPYVQLFTIAIFLMTAYYLFSEARKAEQNQVWVGMSKETAHQLGTPISSMLGWVEYLKMSEDREIQSIVPEIEKDVSRLELITDRFSKIGSQPNLMEHNIINVVQESVDYMERRSPKKVEFSTKFQEKNITARIYPPLFNWVLENLIKNSLDAMDGKGKIHVQVHNDSPKICIDVSDTGKGIKGRNKNIVFRPGYSTKKRGWGLGLSLSKRIIKDYHHGKIYVLQSEKNKGTTFRIELNA